MGYTTKFKHWFDITPEVPEDHQVIDDLNDLNEQGCQWVISSCGSRIEWDGFEKFYNYEGHLEDVDACLSEHGFTLSGQVEFQGERKKDRGTLSIKYHEITKTTNPIEALKKFDTEDGEDD